MAIAFGLNYAWLLQASSCFFMSFLETCAAVCSAYCGSFYFLMSVTIVDLLLLMLVVEALVALLGGFCT